MSCDNPNRPITITSDRGVKYTGEDIESLGIECGMFLDDIEGIVLQKLEDYAQGIGLSLPEVDFTQCAFMEGFISCCAADDSLTGLISTIFKGLCNLDGRITANGSAITNIQQAINFTIVPGCLSVSNTKIDTVLNALIASYCSFQQKVTAIFGSLDNPVVNTTIVNQITDSVLNTVFANIRGCSAANVVKTGTGINTQVEIRGIVPIGAMTFGYWDATHFDSSGLGLSSKNMCGWAVCNGMNGTEDMRGMTPAMATDIYSSRPLDPWVNPLTLGDADTATSIGYTKGAYKVKLSGNETGVGSHTHTATQAAHTHANGAYDRVLQYTGIDTTTGVDADNRGSEPDIAHSQPMLSVAPAITVNANTATEALLAHENRQPTKYLCFIQRVA